MSEIILHIGSPKTGTTTLQLLFHMNRETLTKHGVLYPVGIPMPEHHKALSVALRKHKALPRLLRPMYEEDPDLLNAHYQQMLERIRRNVDEQKPDAVVISAEGLWNTHDRDEIRRLARDLRDIGDTLHVVAYVREPADMYLSHAQQILKASHVLPPVGPRLYKKKLKGFIEVADKLTVSSFERSKLVDGDVVQDFLSKVLPGKPELRSAFAPFHANVTISAEAMDILQQHRQAQFPDKPGVHMPETAALLKRLQGLDAALEGYARPQLYPHVRSCIVSQTTELPWLRERFGISFDKVDYDALPATPEERWRPETVADICHVNFERRDALLKLLDEHDPD